MCGIVAAWSYGKGFWPMEIKIFTDLLYVGALRGTHGTGIFGVSDDTSRFQLKVGGPPDQLFGSKEFESFVKFVKKKDVMALIGHNRFATTGKHTTENAHPFRHGDVTIVHNGTIDSWGKFKKEANKFVVDSDAVCYLINKYGVPEVVSAITGAWAIVGWNAKTEEIFLFKNKERPLHICHRPLSKLWFVASEQEMLDWVLNRSYSIGIQSERIENNILYIFKLGEEFPKKKILETASEKSHRIYAELMEKPEFNRGSAFARSSNDVRADFTIIPEAVEKVRSPMEYPLVASKNSYGLGSGHKTGLVGPAKARGTLKESWVVVQHLKDLSTSKVMDFELSDYDKVKDTSQGFQIVLVHEKYPDVRFIANVVGDKEMETLVMAERISAKIMNIQKSNNNPAVSAHRIVLSELTPVFNSNIILPDEVPENAFLMDGKDNSRHAG